MFGIKIFVGYTQYLIGPEFDVERDVTQLRVISIFTGIEQPTPEDLKIADLGHSKFIPQQTGGLVLAGDGIVFYQLIKQAIHPVVCQYFPFSVFEVIRYKRTGRIQGARRVVVFVDV